MGCHFLPQCMKVKSEVKLLSHVRLFATPWAAAHQALPSMGFSSQEYWSGVPLPSLGSPNWALLSSNRLSQPFYFGQHSGSYKTPMEVVTVKLCVTPLSSHGQYIPLSMEFSRQQYWSGLPFPPPGHLPGPRIKPAFPAGTYG